MLNGILSTWSWDLVKLNDVILELSVVKSFTIDLDNNKDRDYCVGRLMITSHRSWIKSYKVFS